MDGWYEDETEWSIPYLALRLSEHEPDPGYAGALDHLAKSILARSYPELVPYIERLRSEDDDA